MEKLKDYEKELLNLLGIDVQNKKFKYVSEDQYYKHYEYKNGPISIKIVRGKVYIPSSTGSKGNLTNYISVEKNGVTYGAEETIDEKGCWRRRIGIGGKPGTLKSTSPDQKNCDVTTSVWMEISPAFSALMPSESIAIASINQTNTNSQNVMYSFENIINYSYTLESMTSCNHMGPFIGINEEKFKYYLAEEIDNDTRIYSEDARIFLIAGIDFLLPVFRTSLDLAVKNANKSYKRLSKMQKETQAANRAAVQKIKRAKEQVKELRQIPRSERVKR